MADKLEGSCISRRFDKNMKDFFRLNGIGENTESFESLKKEIKNKATWCGAV